VGAAQLASRALKEVLARYGPSTVEAAVHGIIAYAKRRFREEVARWPTASTSRTPTSTTTRTGRRTSTSLQVTVAGAISASTSRLRRPPRHPAYSTFGNTRGYVARSFASMMDPEDPKNEGSSTRST